VTVAKLVQNPPQGSGLVPMLVDEHYEELVRGRPGKLIAAQVLLQAVGTSQRRTKDGIHRTVTYEVVRLEPVRDTHDADNVAWEITRSYELRTTPHGTQTELPLANSPAEKRESLIEALFEWASENDVSQADLDLRWVDYFGGREHASSETVRTGALIQLMEFARFLEAVKDPFAGKDPDESEATDPDEDLDAPDPTPATDEPTTEQPTAAAPANGKLVAVPPFQPPAT